MTVTTFVTFFFFKASQLLLVCLVEANHAVTVICRYVTTHGTGSYIDTGSYIFLFIKYGLLP